MATSTTTKKSAKSKSGTKSGTSSNLNSDTAKRRDNFFGRFARAVATICGKPGTFLIMLSLVVIWAVTGPLFDYSETWQLVINTSTTIITFLMVFVIQNTQNKDTEAMQLKLDELIRATGAANNAHMCLEELSADEIDTIKDTYLELAESGREALRSGKPDANKPDAHHKAFTKK